MDNSLFECLFVGGGVSGGVIPFLRGQAIQEMSLCGSKEPMELSLVVCGIAGPSLCYHLRALSCPKSQGSQRDIPWHRSGTYHVHMGTRRRVYVQVHPYGKG